MEVFQFTINNCEDHVDIPDDFVSFLLSVETLTQINNTSEVNVDTFDSPVPLSLSLGLYCVYKR